MAFLAVVAPGLVLEVLACFMGAVLGFLAAVEAGVPSATPLAELVLVVIGFVTPTPSRWLLRTP